MPNAASGSLKNKDNFLQFFSRILAPNTWCRHSFSPSNSDPKRASHGRTFGAKRCFWILREFSVHFSCASGPRTPGAAAAIPNLILVQNEPPLVALRTKIVFSFLLFFSRILAFNTWCRHSFSPSNSDPKRASHGRTFGTKRCFWILREQR